MISMRLSLACLLLVSLVSRQVTSRGTMTGLDSVNASTVHILGTDTYDLYLHLWNVQNAKRIWEMHGEIELKTTDVRPFVGGGICIGRPYPIGQQTPASEELEDSGSADTETASQATEEANVEEEQIDEGDAAPVEDDDVVEDAGDAVDEQASEDEVADVDGVVDEEEIDLYDCIEFGYLVDLDLLNTTEH